MTAERSPSGRLDYFALVYSQGHYSIEQLLSQSLGPPGLDVLVETASAYRTGESHILDIGCRDAGHLLSLVRRHGCEGVGIDPLDWHIRQANAAVRDAGLAARVRIALARMECCRSRTRRSISCGGGDAESQRCCPQASSRTTGVA